VSYENFFSSEERSRSENIEVRYFGDGVQGTERGLEETLMSSNFNNFDVSHAEEM